MQARRLIAGLVYLPAYPALPARARARLVSALVAAGQADADQNGLVSPPTCAVSSVCWGAGG